MTFSTLIRGRLRSLSIQNVVPHRFLALIEITARLCQFDANLHTFFDRKIWAGTASMFSFCSFYMGFLLSFYVFCFSFAKQHRYFRGHFKIIMTDSHDFYCFLDFDMISVVTFVSFYRVILVFYHSVELYFRKLSLYVSVISCSNTVIKQIIYQFSRTLFVFVIIKTAEKIK